MEKAGRNHCRLASRFVRYCWMLDLKVAFVLALLHYCRIFS